MRKILSNNFFCPEKCTQTDDLKGQQYRLEETQGLEKYLPEFTHISDEKSQEISRYSETEPVDSPRLGSYWSKTRSKERSTAFNKAVKKERKLIASAVVGNVFDIRPYAEIKIFDRLISGLMDTGASISCVDGSFAEDLLAARQNIRPMSSNKVNTADGTPQQLVGKISLF